jgi:hypothetical protein
MKFLLTVNSFERSNEFIDTTTGEFESKEKAEAYAKMFRELFADSKKNKEAVGNLKTPNEEKAFIRTVNYFNKNSEIKNYISNNFINSEEEYNEIEEINNEQILVEIVEQLSWEYLGFSNEDRIINRACSNAFVTEIN